MTEEIGQISKIGRVLLRTIEVCLAVYATVGVIFVLVLGIWLFLDARDVWQILPKIAVQLVLFALAFAGVVLIERRLGNPGPANQQEPNV